MSRWIVCSAVLAAVVGCAEEEPWVVRPPGGGTGSGTAGPDAGVDAASDGGLPAAVAGRVCVTTDLRRPGTCPAVAAAAGVAVRELGAAAGTTSAPDGSFTVTLSGARREVELAVGSTSLVRAVVAAPAFTSGARLSAPVVTVDAWSQTLLATGIQIATGNGAIAVYVVRADGVADQGAGIDLPGAASVGPFYDRDGAWAADAAGTGAAGVALILDLPPGDYALTGRDSAGRDFTVAPVSVVAGAVSFTTEVLPP